MHNLYRYAGATRRFVLTNSYRAADVPQSPVGRAFAQRHPDSLYTDTPLDFEIWHPVPLD